MSPRAYRATVTVLALLITHTVVGVGVFYLAREHEKTVYADRLRETLLDNGFTVDGAKRAVSSAPSTAALSATAAAGVRALSDAQLATALLTQADVPAGYTVDQPSASPSPSASDDGSLGKCDGKPLDTTLNEAFKGGSNEGVRSKFDSDAGFANIDSQAAQSAGQAGAVLDFLEGLGKCKTLTSTDADGTVHDFKPTVTSFKVNGHKAITFDLQVQSPFGNVDSLQEVVDVDGVYVRVGHSVVGATVDPDSIKTLGQVVVDRVDALQAA